jgi:hypothetical protein
VLLIVSVEVLKMSNEMRKTKRAAALGLAAVLFFGALS